MIRRARELTPDVEFIEADILKYPLPHSTYDGIWCNAVLLHFTTSEVKATLQNISQALKPGGVLHVSFMQGKGKRMFQRIDRGVEDKRIFYDRSKQEVIAMLKSNGFKILAAETDPAPYVTFLKFLARKE